MAGIVNKVYFYTLRTSPLPVGSKEMGLYKDEAVVETLEHG